VYEAMKAVYGRVLISLEREADPYIIGREKVYERGSTFKATIWVTNDFPFEIRDAQVSWELVSVDGGEVVDKNEFTATFSADSVGQVDHLQWTIPEDARPGTHRVEMQVLTAAGETLSTNSTDITVR
jgi:beta-mannosidase